MAQPQEAGWIDRIFNSTIAWPQQMLWRIIRAAKEDDIDLFSEKGLLDFSMVPGLGIFDDHKEDVMFDYMSETMGFGEGGWGQFGAAVLSDPLTYMTGGLSTVGKAARGAAMSTKYGSVRDVLKTRASGKVASQRGRFFSEAAKAGLKDEGAVLREMGEATSQLSISELDDVLKEAITNLSGKGTKEARREIGHIKKVQKMLGGVDDATYESTKVIDLLKNYGKRKLAIGLPVLSMLGAKIPIPGQHQSWWRLHQDLKHRGGEALGQTWLTRSVLGIPIIGTALRNMVAPSRQFKGGFQVGAESRVAIRDAMKGTTPEEFKIMSHWLGEGGDLSVGISKRGHTEILKRFDEKIDGGASTTAAFQYALKGIRGKEPILETYARLKGIPIADAKALSITDDSVKFRKELKKDLTTAMGESDTARRLARSGEYDNKLVKLDLDEKANQLLEEQGRLGWGRKLGEISFDAGRKLRAVTNVIFKTGTETAHAQNALHEFLSQAAQGHEQVSQLAKLLFAGVKQVLSKKEMKDWSEGDFTTMVGHLMENHALQVELVESFNLSKMSPENALTGAIKMKDFHERQRSVMKAMELVLTSKGVKGGNRKKILELMQGEVFDFLPRIDEQALSKQFESALEISKKYEKTWTPAQRKRMARSYNKHVFKHLPAWMKKEGLEQVGELSPEQLQRAINDIELKAMDDMHPKEIAGFIDDTDKLSQFRKDHGLTHAEMLSVVNRKTKGKTAEIVRESLLKKYPLWNKARKAWTTNQAQEALAPYGWSLTRSDEGFYTAQPFAATLATAKKYGWKPPKDGFATMKEAMEAQRKWLANPRTGGEWAKKFGPNLEDVTDYEQFVESTKGIIWGSRNPSIGGVKGAEAKGLTPFQMGTQHKFGKYFAVEMSPSEFESLVPAGGKPSTIKHIKSLQKSGGEVAPSFLQVSWDNVDKVWRVSGHEGRSRAKAFKAIEGEKAMPVDLILSGVHRGDLTAEMKRAPIIGQEGSIGGKVTAKAKTRKAVKRTPPRSGELTEKQFKSLKQREVQKIDTKDLNRFRKSLTKEERLVMAGKQKRFREELLPGHGTTVSTKELDAIDWYRLKQAEFARSRSNELGRKEGQRLFEEPNIPERTLTDVSISDPRIVRPEDKTFLEYLEKEHGFVFTGKEGEEELYKYASAYARSSLNIHELNKWLQMQKKKGVTNPEIPYELINDIHASLAEMGTRVSDTVLNQLPKEAREMFSAVRHISSEVFRAAKEAGHLDAGFPIGYIGRFFTKAGRARVERVLNTMLGDSEGLTILKRITNKSPHMLARHSDTLSIDEYNALNAELTKAIASKHPATLEWHKEIEAVMKEEGYRVKGLRKPLVYTDERLETDPFLATLARLGNANQEKSVEDYFSNWLRASDLGQGESMALGGKVVAVWDDAGDVIAVPHKRSKVVERRSGKQLDEVDADGKPTDRKVQTKKMVTEVDEPIESGKPTWIVIKTDDGHQHVIPAAMDKENGLGLLRLGKPGEAKNLGYTPTVAKSFVHMSGTGNLDNEFYELSDLMKKGTLQETLLGHHVVFGSKPAIVGGVKTAAKTLEVTSQAWRTYDNINYMIKSFQTIFRVPFHVANLASGTFQALQAGARPLDLMHGYIDTFKLLMGNTEFIRHSDTLLSLMPGVDGFTSNHSWFRMPRLDFAQAARRNGGSIMNAPTLEKLKELNIDRVDDFHMNLGHGQQIAMSEFIRTAGDMQLYGTYASTLTRGSRTIADSLMVAKMQALDPTMVTNIGGRALGKVIETLGGRPGELREVTEVINRTATAIALMRGGHSMQNAISITRSAHVPYERLTWTEKNVIKRASLYYTFPRHYIPWAWTKFMEDPVKLSEVSNLIRDKRMISTEEGRVALALGDYRLDVGRLNANTEAAMFIASFADSFAQPLGHMVGMGARSMHPYDPNILTNQITDMGLTGAGGLFSGLFGARRLLPQGNRTSMGTANAWDEARRIIWPMKLMGAVSRVLGGDAAPPTKEEQSPYVDYTWIERFIADTDFGLGVRKVRPQAEFNNAYYEYKSIVRQLGLKAAATKDPEMRDKYSENLKVLTDALHVIKSDAERRYEK